MLYFIVINNLALVAAAISALLSVWLIHLYYLIRHWLVFPMTDSNIPTSSTGRCLHAGFARVHEFLMISTSHTPLIVTLHVFLRRYRKHGLPLEELRHVELNQEGYNMYLPLLLALSVSPLLLLLLSSTCQNSKVSIPSLFVICFPLWIAIKERH